MATPTDDSRRISASVSRALRDAGLVQRKVSAETGIPMTTLVRMLTGKKAIDTDTLYVFAGMCGHGHTIAPFVEDAETPEPVAS